MRPTSIRGPAPLLLPGSALLVFLLVLPLLYVAEQSFRGVRSRPHRRRPGQPLHAAPYLELVHPVYLRYLAAMVRIGLISTLAGVALAYPIAYFVARRRANRVRTARLGFLIAMMFLSVLVRVYSLALSSGPVGIGPVRPRSLACRGTAGTFAEILVIAGSMHLIVPWSALLAGRDHPERQPAARGSAPRRWARPVEGDLSTGTLTLSLARPPRGVL